MADNGLRAYYLDIYNELNKSVILAKDIVKRTLPLKIESQNLIKEISEIKKELDRIFVHPILYKICNGCHRQSLGGCCKNKTDSYLLWRDLIYLVSENLNFKLTYPDLNFLTSLEKPACLFLGSQGCLFKEKRPIVCLGHRCFDLELGEKRLIGEKILSEGQIQNLIDNLTQKTRLLFIHIFSKVQPPSDNSLVDYGLLHVLNNPSGKFHLDKFHILI